MRVPGCQGDDLAKKQTEAMNVAYLGSGMRVPGCQGDDDSVGKEADRGNDREPEGVAGPGQALARPLALLPEQKKHIKVRLSDFEMSL